MDRVEQAAQGLRLIEEAIIAELGDHPTGLYNSEIARAPKMESEHQGRHDNYLTYSVLGGLLKAGRVLIEKRNNRNYYLLVPIT